MSESFENVLGVVRRYRLLGDKMCNRLQRAHEHELEQARDPQRIGGTLERGSFEYAIEQLREFRWQHATNDEDAIPYINNVARAHEQASKAEYHRGYEDGQRSMDAEHRAVCHKLMRVILDGDNHTMLSRLAYAIYPCATGWTGESCEGLRERIIELLGGVHDEPVSDIVRGFACAADCDHRDGQQGRIDKLLRQRDEARAKLDAIREVLDGAT